MKYSLQFYMNTGRYLLYRFSEEGYYFRAAALAYDNILAILPMLIICLSIISMIPGLDTVPDRLETYIAANFLFINPQFLTHYVDSFLNNVRYLSIVNIFFVVVLAVFMVYSVSTSFDLIWEVKQPRPFIQSFIVYLGVLIVAPILIGGIFVIGFVLQNNLLALLSFHIAYFNTIMDIISVIINYFVFVLLYWILPSIHVPFKSAAMGGLVSLILFEIWRHVFLLYLYYVKTYQILYGVMATLPLFLIWLYFFWVIILIGAMISHLLTNGIVIKRLVNK